MVTELRPGDQPGGFAGALDSRALVEHLITQGVGVLSRVLDRVVDDLTVGQGPEADTDQDVEGLVADAIADRISGLLRGSQDPLAEPGRPWPDAEVPVEQEPLEAADDQLDVLQHRNSVLADALGACGCWGTDTRCPVCLGDGAPGWMSPDQRLFDAIVRPAVDEYESMTRDREYEMEEDGHVSDGTRQ